MIRKRSRAQGVQNRQIERHVGSSRAPVADGDCRVGHSALNGFELHRELLISIPMVHRLRPMRDWLRRIDTFCRREERVVQSCSL